MASSFDPRTIGPRIRMLLPELTGAEAPLKRVAEDAEVSEAMVVKTAKRLGFGGYKEQRAALHVYKIEPFVDLNIAVTKYSSSPLAEMSDVVLCSTAQRSCLTSENAAERIVQINIMDSIFTALAQKRIEPAKASLSKTMAAVHLKRRA